MLRCASQLKKFHPLSPGATLSPRNYMYKAHIGKYVLKETYCYRLDNVFMSIMRRTMLIGISGKSINASAKPDYTSNLFLQQLKRDLPPFLFMFGQSWHLVRARERSRSGFKKAAMTLSTRDSVFTFSLFNWNPNLSGTWSASGAQI